MVAMITLSECSKYVITLLLNLFPSYFVVPVMEDVKCKSSLWKERKTLSVTTALSLSYRSREKYLKKIFLAEIVLQLRDNRKS